jgi:predicted membrane protein
MGEQDYGQEFKDKLKQEIHERIHRDVHEKINQPVSRPKVMLLGDVRWGFAWGLIIVLIGVGLLLEHLGVIPFDPLARYWPLLLVVFGVMNLTTQSGRFFGFLLIFAGIFLQLNKLGITHFSFADLWPIALIAVGLLLMWGSLETRGFLRAKAKAFQDFRDQVTGATGPLTMLNAVAIFGGCERRVAGANFEGGKATAVFGGIELDFRDADINDEAILEVNCVFGGVEIRVPETWHVHSRSLPVFGGFEDKTRQPYNPGKTKTLIITGMVVFGGIEIKN